MSSAAWGATAERIERELTTYRSTYGAQVVVMARGECLVSIAAGHDGTGRRLTEPTLFRVYCTVKPYLATLIARLVDDRVLDLDEPLESSLGALPVLAGGVTLRHLLTHTAGLPRPMAFEMELLPPERRRPAIESMTRHPGFRLGVDAAYSEYASWHLAGWAVEHATGEPLGRTLRAWLDALGLHETWIGMPDDVRAALRERIGLNHDFRGARAFPMGLEIGRRWCTETNPAHGGYTTMRDLARFYSLLLEQLDGDTHRALPSAVTLATFCSAARPAVHDPVLDRTCRFGLGFMAPLGDHAFGDTLGPTAFGHSGYAGSSFGLADPGRGLVVAATFNGIIDHPQAFQRRVDLLRAIDRDLDAIAVSAS